MAKRAWWVALLSVLLAACGSRVAAPTTTSPGDRVPVHALVKHRVVSDISLDGGAFTAQPPGDAKARFPLSRAKRVVLAASTGVHGPYDPALVALGRVTLALKHPGLPSYQDRLAWVGFVSSEGFTASCPPPTGTPTSGTSSVSPSTYNPYFFIVVLDAGTGKAVLDYRTRGTGNCGGVFTGPRVLRADELLSVPWSVTEQPDKQWTYSYAIPRCDRDYMRGGYGPTETSFVIVEGPIDPPSHCSPARTLTATVPSGITADHAPTGVTTGTVMNGVLVTF